MKRLLNTLPHLHGNLLNYMQIYQKQGSQIKTVILHKALSLLEITQKEFPGFFNINR